MTKVMMAVAAKSGGTVRHVVELARGCRRRGLDIHLVCATGWDAHARRELAARNIAIDELDMKRKISPASDARAVRRLRKLVAGVAPDVLHLHSSKAGAIGRIAMFGQRAARPAVVYTPHAYAFQTQAGMFKPVCYRWIERALMPSTDCVVAVSQSEGQTAARLGAKGRVVVIANGVEPRQAPAACLGRDPQPLRIGWLGRMTWQKQPQIAVKVSDMLHGSGLAHELHLAGDGSMAPQLLRSIRGARCEGRVLAFGQVRDIDTFYSGIDVFLTTSRGEGLPYAGLDAMSRGIPIVGFDVPGVRDLVEQGVTGALVSFGDVAALAAELSRLARDECLRAAMGAAARERARESFDLDAQIDRLCLLYRSLAGIRGEQLRWH